MGKHSVQNQRKRSLALRKIYKKKFPHTKFALDSKSVHKIVTTQIRSGILEEIWSDIPDLTNIVEVERRKKVVIRKMTQKVKVRKSHFQKRKKRVVI